MEGAQLTVPQMGVVEQVIVLEWLVEDGAAVDGGQEVVMVETEKAEVGLEAPAAGVINILVPASDDEVAVGTVLAVIVP